jgi:hypothetical protein
MTRNIAFLAITHVPKRINFDSLALIFLLFCPQRIRKLILQFLSCSTNRLKLIGYAATPWSWLKSRVSPSGESMVSIRNKI